jgi:hypothetical protein
VHDQVPGLTTAAGLAEIVELEERRAGDEPAAAQPGEQGHVPGRRDQARLGTGGQDGRGQVNQLAVLPPRAGGDHGEATRAQQDPAAGQDLGEPVEQLVQAAAGEVGGVTSVAVVVLADAALGAAALLGGDLAVDGRPVRRRGDDQGGAARGAGREQGGQLTGVAADHLGGPGRALPTSVGHVGGDDLGPAVLLLDAEAVAPLVDSLDQGGADTAYRVGDQVPGPV